MGFATCKEDAIALAQTIPGSGIGYGIFIPDTPREKWDSSWNKKEYAAFTHFWVETEDKIYDSGSEQFGYSELIVSAPDDPKYVRVGKFIPETDECIAEVQYPKICWDTFTKGETVLVEWEP